MREYYRANPDKFRRTPEQQAEYNRRRRERYAADAEYRERVKRQAKITPEQRRERTLREYGITPEQYDTMLAEQGGGCAICGVEFAHRGGARLAVDHCHETGAVRGLLCSNCNQGLGKFGDDPERLDRAGMYLRAHRRPPAVDQ